MADTVICHVYLHCAKAICYFLWCCGSICRTARPRYFKIIKPRFLYLHHNKKYLGVYSKRFLLSCKKAFMLVEVHLCHKYFSISYLQPVLLDFKRKKQKANIVGSINATQFILGCDSATLITHSK